MNRLTFGKELKKKRIKKGWTLSQAAPHIGISVTMTALLEAGGIQKPGLETIFGLSRAYNIPREEIERVFFPDLRKEVKSKCITIQ